MLFCFDPKHNYYENIVWVEAVALRLNTRSNTSREEKEKWISDLFFLKQSG